MRRLSPNPSPLRLSPGGRAKCSTRLEAGRDLIPRELDDQDLEPKVWVVLRSDPAEMDIRERGRVEVGRRQLGRLVGRGESDGGHARRPRRLEARGGIL